MNPNNKQMNRRSQQVAGSSPSGKIKYRKARRRRKYNVFRIVCALLIFVSLVAGGIWLVSRMKTDVVVSSSAEQGNSSVAAPSEVSSVGLFVPQPVGEHDEGGVPFLVNRANPLAEGYVPELVEIGDGYLLEPRAAEGYKNMLLAAKEEGIVLWVVSAYRSNQTQTTNFNNRVAQHKAEGHSDEESYRLAARYIAVPGTSEHEAGLALDLNSLSSSFDQTPEYAWLIANAPRFGFIMRYDKATEPITLIAYEPWHFRYIGSNHAVAIQEMGITLEEYVALLKGEDFVPQEQ